MTTDRCGNAMPGARMTVVGAPEEVRIGKD